MTRTLICQVRLSQKTTILSPLGEQSKNIKGIGI